VCDVPGYGGQCSEIDKDQKPSSQAEPIRDGRQYGSVNDVASLSLSTPFVHCHPISRKNNPLKLVALNLGKVEYDAAGNEFLFLSQHMLQ
jgi:hypothetical protein